MMKRRANTQKHLKPIALTLLLGCLSVAAVPQEAVTSVSATTPVAPDPGSTPPPAPCTAEEHRQFDFWIGEWDVFGPDGSVAGTNTIESILGGCVLTETWTGAAGGTGRSLNMFYKSDGKWHQTWVDGRGGRLDIAGKLVDGKMTMWGEMPARDGGWVMHKITWHPLEGGDVRQHWQASRDGGTTWKDLFNGTYKRKVAAQQ